MEKCPNCREEIQEDAITCKHCGHDVRVNTSAPPEPIKEQGHRPPSMGYIILAIVDIFICVFLCFVIYNRFR